MAKPLSMRIDFATLQERVAGQFRGLNQNDPGTWPPLPRYTVYAVVLVLALALGWYLWLSGVKQQLDSARQQEVQLRTTYRAKLAQAVSLDLLRAQKAQVEQYVLVLEKQLPGKAEMDALLSDINQAGIGRGLQFDLFRPGQVDVRDYYAQLPISIEVQGSYDDLAAFTSDIARLSRIVTINDISIGKGTQGRLRMNATAMTYRYLDPDEIAAQQAHAGARRGGRK